MKSDLDSFSADGFVLVRGFLPTSELVQLRGELDSFLTTQLRTVPDCEIYYEDVDVPQSLKQVQQLGQHSQFFYDLQHSGRFRELAAMLLAGPVVPKNLQYFNKPPQIGRATPPHQDGFYFMLQPCEAVTMWFALDDADEENGCVRYVRGSHKRGLRNHTRTDTLGFSQGIADYPTADDTANDVAVHAEAGDLLVHHALTIHRADGNPSQRHRRALGFVYYSADTKEDTVAHAAYQARLASDLRDEGRI